MNRFAIDYSRRPGVLPGPSRPGPALPEHPASAARDLTLHGCVCVRSGHGQGSAFELRLPLVA